MVEITVAVGLLVLGTLSTLATIAGSNNLQGTSRRTKKASMLANDLLERYRSVGSGGLVNRLLSQGFPGNQVGNYTVVGGGVEGNFIISGTVNGEASELKGASVVTAVLTEFEVQNEMPTDLDGDGTVEFPVAGDSSTWDDVLDLDRDGDPENSVTGAYNVVPVRITVSYTTSQNDSQTLVLYSVIYPTSTSAP